MSRLRASPATPPSSRSPCSARTDTTVPEIRRSMVDGAVRVPYLPPDRTQPLDVPHQRARGDGEHRRPGGGAELRPATPSPGVAPAETPPGPPPRSAPDAHDSRGRAARDFSTPGYPTDSRSAIRPAIWADGVSAPAMLQDPGTPRLPLVRELVSTRARVAAFIRRTTLRSGLDSPVSNVVNSPKWAVGPIKMLGPPWIRRVLAQLPEVDPLCHD